MVTHEATAEVPIVLTGSGAGQAFTVTCRRDGARSVVAIAGELDMATAPLLDRVLRRLCSPAERELEIDVAELTFCDCSGLSVLLHAARRRGRSLTLSHSSPALRRLIGLADVARALRLTEGHTLGTLPHPGR